MARVIIGVLTAAGYETRRHAVRTTWGRDVLSRDDCEMLFLIGDPFAAAPRLEGDTLFLPCPDDYDSLPQKTRWFCKWALERTDWHYLFKCDDDTYVHIGRLLEQQWDAPVVGGQHTDEYHFHGGAGYVISRAAANAISEFLCAKVGLEDWEAMDAIHHAGLSFILDYRLCWSLDQIPHPTNDIITSHYVSPIRMRLIHDAFAPAVSSDSNIPQLLHHIWLGGGLLPQHLEDYRNSWQRHHPEWTSRIWTDQEVLEILEPEHRSFFHRLRTPAQRTHLARYAVLRKFGGVYVDFDVECIRPITSLVAAQNGFAAAEDDEVIGVAVLGCKPNDALMARCIDALLASTCDGYDCPAESGSVFFTGHYLTGCAWKLLPWSTFYPIHWGDRETVPLNDAFAVHYWQGGWRQLP